MYTSCEYIHISYNTVIHNDIADIFIKKKTLYAYIHTYMHT